MSSFCYSTVQYIASPPCRIGSNGILAFRQTDSELITSNEHKAANLEQRSRKCEKKGGSCHLLCFPVSPGSSLSKDNPWRDAVLRKGGRGAQEGGAINLPQQQSGLGLKLSRVARNSVTVVHNDKSLYLPRVFHMPRSASLLSSITEMELIPRSAFSIDGGHGPPAQYTILDLNNGVLPYW
jgi:hypothetical protein